MSASSNGNGSGGWPVAESGAESHSHASILIVDDNVENLTLLRAMLKSLHQPVVTASSGEMALAAVGEEEFSVILLDVQMPGLDGFEVAERIRASGRNAATPIIFVTAMCKERDEVSRGYSLGAVDYMFKPVIVEILRAKVAVFIELFLQRQALRQALARATAAELRASEQAAELQRSNEELQQFAYVASHDLKEPLRMVTSYVQLLARRYAERLDTDAKEFIGFATGGAERMRALIDDLLHYSRVGSRAAALEPVDCASVISVVMANLEVAIAESGAEVRTGALPTVFADRVQIEQLFQNLIANAIKFRSERKPVVTIAAQRVDSRDDGGSGWRFCVRDNGIGIDPQFAARIFLIFQRLHRREEYPGTGIGLAVCKKIVERRGGRIWVESQTDAGAVFFFTIPDRVSDEVGAATFASEEKVIACESNAGQAA
jgi:signal transduction histidine kinase